MSLPTPNIAHLTEEDYDHVYEPAEDSFILLDALEIDAEEIRLSKPAINLEIGSGSGVVSTFLSNLLGPNESYVISTDINSYACKATQRTAAANQTTLDGINCNLLSPLLSRLHQQVDILLFNPPYVPTDADELSLTQEQKDIGGAWAGGFDGMAVTNLVLDQLPDLLSPAGRLYLVAVQQNKTTDIAERMLAMGLHTKVGLDSGIKEKEVSDLGGRR
ncbi:hypothetical protein L198_01682 [Cryptococcus wingfieldii CBS 7118]|uniref:Methyltransferase small domain-containing protein n=2 Tax=Cryptococcus TaxID=5206 RepID=A0A1E3K027_9TREE|nr:hypothetical protein L198_01682 [Cryptococcus wingfieldii CBS 7118]ODO06450.1 hypothetical protein L198_01682 [Cryptococcus wingfieldii CBS 7118]TYJ58675.1 hypothetical protein B9479_000511 [Cryptococcus floricola]